MDRERSVLPARRQWPSGRRTPCKGSGVHPANWAAGSSKSKMQTWMDGDKISQLILLIRGSWATVSLAGCIIASHRFWFWQEGSVVRTNCFLDIRSKIGMTASGNCSPTYRQAEASSSSSFSHRKQLHQVIYFVIDHVLFSGSLFFNMESGNRMKQVRNIFKDRIVPQKSQH